MEMIRWDSGHLIDLIIVSSGRTKELISMTQNCIDSFHKTCLGRVIVVGEFPIEYHGATTIPQDKPFNYNQSLNKGFLLTSADWVCFSNNDVEFLGNWADCIDHGYKSLSCLNPGWKFHEGMKGIVEGYRIGYELCGWCLILHRGVMERIGGFPEEVRFWKSDDLYADILKHYKIKHALISSCKIKHNPSTTLLQSGKLKELTTGQEEKYQKAKEKWIKS
jgi:hypothetical protein